MALFRKVIEPIGGGALLQGIQHWGRVLKFYSLSSFLFSLCSSLLHSLLPLLMPCHDGLQPLNNCKPIYTPPSCFCQGITASEKKLRQKLVLRDGAIAMVNWVMCFLSLCFMGRMWKILELELEKELNL